MVMKGSDEELPLSMVKEKAQGVGSSFFSGQTLGITMSIFFLKKKSQQDVVTNVAKSSVCLKKTLFPFLIPHANDPPFLPLVYIINSK